MAGLSARARTHGVGDRFAVVAFGDGEVVALLQVQPEPGGGAEVAGEPERGVGADLTYLFLRGATPPLRFILAATRKMSGTLTLS